MMLLPCIVNDTLVTIPCEPFPQAGELGYFFVEAGEQFTAPSFNPNNSNEFAYVSQIQGEPRKLMKYDIVSKVHTELSNSTQIIGTPVWDQNNWIAFSAVGKKIWRIDGNGNNLQQITFEEKDILPNFYNGDICYFRSRTYSNFELDQNPNLYYEYMMMIVDVNGIKLDSIEVENVVPNSYYQYWLYGDFKNDIVYFVGQDPGATNTYYGVYSLNLITEEITSIETEYFSGVNINILDLEYANGRIYCSLNYGDLLEIDLSNNSVKALIKGCQTHFYKSLSASNDSSSLLAEKLISKELESGEIDQQHEIWQIDLITGKEKQIIGE